MSRINEIRSGLAEQESLEGDVPWMVLGLADSKYLLSRIDAMEEALKEICEPTESDYYLGIRLALKIGTYRETPTKPLSTVMTKEKSIANS